MAFQHLEELGVLDQLPERLEGETDMEFARKLGTLCNAPDALSSEYGPRVMSPDWLQAHVGEPERTGEAMFCLMSAGIVSGFPIGFLGNELMAGSEAGS